MADIEADQVAHLQQIAVTLRRRLRVLETQTIGYGPLAVPAHIVLEREDVERNLEQVLADLRRFAVVPSNVRAPYLGLQTFHEADADQFFGREALVGELLERAGRTAFLAVLGASGSGKSSVVHAGLIPILKGGGLAGSERWRYITLKPGQGPLDTLAAALAKLQAGDTVAPLGTSVENALALRRQLAESDRALLVAAEVLLDRAAGQRLVLVVDQAEELWSLAPSEPHARTAFVEQQQRPFIQLLETTASTLAAVREPPLLIVLTMRADFLHRAAEYPALSRALSDQLVIVSPMLPAEMRSAILRPAESAGAGFEPGLVDELVEQAQGRPGALPLLEYTLLELWKERQPDGTLSWEAFRALGGVEGGLARRADSILAEHYTPAQRDELRAMLLRLVQPGEGAADTRRRAALLDLTYAGSEIDAVQALLTPLADARLLTTSHDDTSGAETVEIAHEALIHAWPTFAQWIADARADLRFQLQLEEAAKEWQANSESADFLWAGLRLANAEAWCERARPRLNQRDQRFLEASRDRERERSEHEENARRRELRLERRARRLLQVVVAIMSLLTVVSTGLLIVLGGPELTRQRARRAGTLQPAGGPRVSFERYEVTNQRYALCVEAGRCTPPTRALSTYFDRGTEMLPVTGVTGFDAAIFCQWIGRRLPRREEWELAANWPQAKSKLSAQNANLSFGAHEQTAIEPVGSRSPTNQIYDLVGNVFEWTATSWGDGTSWDGDPAAAPKQLTFVGGSYKATPAEAVPQNADVTYRGNDIGFRCVEGGQP